MQDLIAQERFEMEVLNRLNSGRFLKDLIFIGGTMLRLCHGLDRFSVDLDFRLLRTARSGELFSALAAYLPRFYGVRDSADNLNTLLFELQSPDYPRRLKIEIRKDEGTVQAEQSIAFSRHATAQVLLRTATLDAMMAAKIAAFLDRKEIRDAYDLEFLVKRGIRPQASEEVLLQVADLIGRLTEKDYKVKLGSLIEPELRPYYRKENFRILKAALGK